MPPPQQQQSQQGDQSLAPFWIIIGIFALSWGVWYFAHQQIAAVILKFKLIEAELIGLFFNTTHLVQMIKNTSSGGVTFTGLSTISTLVGNYLRIPVAVILGLLSVVMYLGHATLRYKKVYTMHSLLEVEKENWPQITPVSHLDLVNMDIDVGPWAMAASPMQFAKKYRLLQEERMIGELLSQQRIVVSLRRDMAQQVFASQLGQYWTGIDNLNIQTKALFAVFAARINLDQVGASKLLLQIAASTESGKLDFSGVNELLEKHRNCKAVIKITENYAFVLTVMAAMLAFARLDGVLAAADFLWLKPVDRPLWFMMSSVGRQTPFAEVSGPFAHWLAEKKVGRKLSVPMVDEAVNALEKAINEVIYIPDQPK